MSLLVVAVHILSIFCSLVHSIHVPGENVDKNTLTTLGIKTIGWQNSESTSKSSNVSVYHNYSKISLQIENLESYPQYAQSQTNFGGTPNKQTKGGVNKGPRNSVSSQTTISQGEHGQFGNTVSHTSKNTGQRKDGFSQSNWSGEGEQGQVKLTANSNKLVSQSQQINSHVPYTSSSGSTITSNHQSSGNGFENQFSQSDFELSKIIETEKQNRKSQSLDYDQETLPTNNILAQNVPPHPSQPKQTQLTNLKPLSDPKTYQHKHTENLHHVLVAYTKCPEATTGQFIYKSSCQQFLNCWNGRGFAQNCAAGTLFNPQTLECDHASKVRCLTDSSSLHSEKYTNFNAEHIHKAGINCPPGFSGVIPHQTDCSKFINCANGAQNVMNCPPGTLFSLRINNCDYPHNAECAGWSVEFGSNGIDGQRSEINQVFGGNNYGSTQNSWENQQTSFDNQHEASLQRGNEYLHTGSSQWQLPNTSENYQTGEYHVGVQNSHGKTQNQNNYKRTETNEQHTGSGYYSNNGNPSYQNQNKFEESNTNLKYTGLGSDGYQYVYAGSEPPIHQSFPTNQNINYRGSNTNTQYTGSGSVGHQGFVQNQHQQNSQHQYEEIINDHIQKVGYDLQQKVDHTPKCPHGANGLFPHPTVCAKFLNCANGQMFIQECGPGTIFNPRFMVCDFPYNVECRDYTNVIDRSEPNEPSHTDSNHNVQKASGNGHPQYENDDELEEAGTHVHGKYLPVKNTGDYGNINVEQQSVGVGDGEVKCPNHPVGFYPHPTVCTKYFMCSNGKPIIYKCGSGTVFNPLTKVCNIPRNVKCYESPNYNENSNQQHGQTTNTNANNQNSNSGTYHQNQGSSSQNKQQGSSNKNTQGTFELNQNGARQTNITGGPNYVNSGKQSSKEHGKYKEVCSFHDFYCTSNLCIPKSMECDGTKDCPNGIDEQNCGKIMDRFVLKEKSVLAMRENERYSNITLAECAKGCLDSKGFKCKSFSYRTDAECFLSDSNIGLCGALIDAEPYSYYELAALTIDCSNLHKCPNNKCINHTQICDGVNDCGDRSDEKGCAADLLGYQIRLAGTNSKHEGRIEIKAFGKWGYICDDRFGMRDADVVCHELGFPLGALEIKGNSYYAKDMDITDVLYLMDDVVCFGNETSIRDCDFSGWGVSNCEPQEIVGVVCKTPVEKCPKDHFKCNSVQDCVPLAFLCDNVFDCPDQSDELPHYCEAPPEIRLVNGKTEREGRIEIRHHGIWGTVCDDDFNDDAAKVVCNTLGFPGKASVKKDGYFGEGEGPIWLDQVFCQGNETLLQQCTHWNWGEHNCEHVEDVGVVCSSNSITSSPFEIDKKSNADSPSNLIEVPPSELLPTDCGLRKNALFYVDEVNFRVVQGSVAKQGFYPWQASLRIKSNGKPSHWCGAVVISKKFALTAAHCLRGFSKGSIIVVAGDYNTDDDEGTEQEIYIEEFYVHDEFGRGKKMNNDIALVKLKGTGFTFTKDIQPICLPDSDLSYINQLNCTISGFGTVQTGKSGYSHDLRAGWVPIQPPEVCRMPHVYGSSITDGMFCAGSLDEGVDACEGDSGGPLACLHDGVFTLYGITSWGQHCGHANKPGVYVKVATYRDWIDKTMRKYAV